MFFRSMEEDTGLARDQWATRFGFVMALIGAVVGSGNIWRMPYVAGMNGGGAFLVIYLVLLYLIAVPGLMAETLLGRYTQRGVIGAFKNFLGEGWSEGLGLVVVIVNIGLMSYYAPVIAWTIYYLAHAVLGTFYQPGFDPTAFWAAFSGSPLLVVGLHTLVAVLVGFVLLFGISDGIERVVKWMIPALVVTLSAVAIKGLTLPGAMEGLAFAFNPEWEYMTDANTWIAALGQALFSTGLGWGIALTYGSYLGKNDDVPLGGGLITAVGNTSIGLLAIFTVFPAVFAFGLEPTTGAELTFVSLVSIFPSMTGGYIWGLLFFLGFLFATYSSGLGITEVGVTTVKEETRLTRTQSVIAVVGAWWLLGIPSAYSSEFLGWMDFMFGNFGLPLATLMILILVGWVIDSKRARILDLNHNSDVYIGSYWDPIIKYVIPTVMVFIMGYYFATNIEDPRAISGLALMGGLTIGSILLMQFIRRGKTNEPALTPGGD